MARPKKNTEPAKQQKRKMYAVRDQFLEAVRVLTIRRGYSDATECINQLVREGLERAGLWPPDGGSP